MEKFQWEISYETGIPAIDSQHKKLFETIDDLALKIYKGESKTRLRPLLEFLEEYIEKHFSEEEKIMESNFYPDLMKHQEQHQKFAKLLEDFKKDFFDRGINEYLAIRVEKELRKWWENHVLNIDMLYVPYISREKNI